MADYGIKVSLDGFDVTTVSPENTAIHSSHPSPQIDVTTSPLHYGVIKVSFPNGMDGNKNLLKSIAHGFAYRPAAIGTAEFENGDGSINYDGVVPISGGAGFRVELEITDTDIELYADQNTEDGVIDNGSTLDVSFYIFTDSISS